MISCMTMIFTLHFTLNNFCEPQKYEHFLSKMFFKAYYRIILRKFGRKFLSLNKSSKKEKYFFHLCLGGTPPKKITIRIEQNLSKTLIRIVIQFKNMLI